MKSLWDWFMGKRPVDWFPAAGLAGVLLVALFTHKRVLTGIIAGCEAMIAANVAEDEWDGDHQNKEFEFILMGPEHTSNKRAVINFFIFNDDGRRKTYNLDMYEALDMAGKLEDAIFRAKKLEDDYRQTGSVVPQNPLAPR